MTGYLRPAYLRPDTDPDPVPSLCIGALSLYAPVSCPSMPYVHVRLGLQFGSSDYVKLTESKVSNMLLC